MLTNCRAIAAALCLLCGLFPGLAHAAQTNVQSGSPFVVDVWGTANGLPDDSVLSLVQTRDGYLWVGTLHGLVRFDGLRFTPFDETGSLGLASSRIVHLFEDTRSNLWIGTESSGIVVAKKSGEIEHISMGQGMPRGFLNSATEDQNGTVWIQLLNGMLARYWSNNVEPVSGPFRSVIAEKNGPLWLATDSELFPILAPAGSSAMIVQQQLQVPVDNFRFLLASKTEGYWRFAGGRIQKWKINQLQRDFGPYPWDSSTPITAACEDDQGNLIVGTYGDGVYWFDANGKFTHLLSELTHGSVLSLAFDSEGNLWIGTNGRGLNRVKRKAFSVLPVSKDLVVQSVSPDKNGGLWIAYNGNRIDHWSDGATEQYSLLQDPRVAVGAYAKSVFVAKDGRVFAGVSGIPGEMLFEWDGKKFAPASVRIDSYISAIHQDRTGRIWIGTYSGLFLLEGSELRQFKDGLPSLDVHAIADDADGNLWVGTGGGLACLRDGKFTSFHNREDLPSEDISALLVDSDGVLWIGTRGGGLARFFKNRWTHYTTAQGLAGNSIGYLIEDSETNLWLGSNSGLTRVAKKSLNDFASDPAHDVICQRCMSRMTVCPRVNAPKAHNRPLAPPPMARFGFPRRAVWFS